MTQKYVQRVKKPNFVAFFIFQKSWHVIQSQLHIEIETNNQLKETLNQLITLLTSKIIFFFHYQGQHFLIVSIERKIFLYLAK